MACKRCGAGTPAVCVSCVSDLTEQQPPDWRQPIPELAGSYPVVLYFPTREDRDEFMRIAQMAMPNATARTI